MEEQIIFPVNPPFLQRIVIKHLWDRFIRRITTLRYTVWIVTLASRLIDPKFGFQWKSCIIKVAVK